MFGNKIRLVKKPTQLRRAKCGKTPSEISEYVTAAAMDGYATAEDYVRENEGTFDPVHNKFLCTSCYVDLGCPVIGVGGVLKCQ